MLNIFLSSAFNFDELVAMSGRVGADFNLRAHFRNSMQIALLRKAISEGKRAWRIMQRRR